MKQQTIVHETTAAGNVDALLEVLEAAGADQEMQLDRIYEEVRRDDHETIVDKSFGGIHQ